MQTLRHVLSPAATLGTSRELVSLHFGTPGCGQKVYIQASLHADELPGMLVAHHLRERLEALEASGALRGEVVLVPVANPLGLSQRLLHGGVGRFELDSGENFNRHYPALSDAVWAEVGPQLDGDAQVNVRRVRAALRRAVAALPVATELAALRRTLLGLACDADVVLDLHCDHEAVLHLYTGTALWEQAEPLARALGAQACLLADDSGDQPFDEACSQPWWRIAALAGDERPVPAACLAVTVELRGETDIDHARASSDARGLLDFLTWRGVIAPGAGGLPPLPPLRAAPTPLAGSMPVVAPVSGVVAWLRDPGAQVEAGERLADVVDPITGEVSALLSPVDGLLYARQSRRFAVAGARMAKVAGSDARRTGKLLSA